MEKKRFHTGISLKAGMDIYSLRALAQNDPTGFIGKAERLIEEGAITLGRISNWPGLYAALADVSVPINIEVGGAQRAVTASAFPVLAGNTIVAAINAAYESVDTIGQHLVEEIEDNKKVTTVAAIHSLDKNVDEVKETEDFPEIGSTEESVEIRHRKNGRILKISAEMIQENEAPNITARVNALGEIASDYVEELTLKRVTDYNGSAASGAEPYAYRPDGTGTALYSATANTPGTRAPSGNCVESNAFVDESDLDAARTRLATMKNNRGTRITVPRSEIGILCPDAILSNVLKTLSSEYVPGVENELSMWGPRGKFNIPVERVFSSPKLDDLSASAWYYGAFRRQFKRKWKLRFEYVTLGQDTQAYLQSQIAFQARVAWDCEVGATDYVNVIQNLSGSTFPIDE